MSFAQEIEVALLHHVRIESVGIGGKPLAVVLTDCIEQGKLVTAVLTESERNRQVDYGIGGLMKPEVLIRRVVRTAGCSQEGVVRITQFAGEIVGTQVLHFVHGVRHAVMTD